MSQKKSYTKIGFTIFYCLLWCLPFGIFLKDFFSLEEFKLLVSSGNFNFNSLANSFTQATLTTILSLLIALVPAYYLAYNNKNFLSRVLDKLFYIPFAFPTISAVISFSIIFRLPIFKLLGLNYSLGNIIIANVFYNSPIFLKYISETLRKIPKELEEEAQVQGVTSVNIFFRIKLPLLVPTICKAGFLVFLYSFTSFVLVIALGGIKYSTMEADIANTLASGSNFTKVILFGSIQSLILVALNFIFSRVEEYELLGEKYDKKTNLITKWVATIYFILTIGVIIVGIIFSFINFYTGEFSFVGFKSLFSSELNEIFPVIQSFVNSTLISLVSSVIIIIFTYCLVRVYNKFLGFVLFFTFGLSSAFIGITLIYTNISYDVPLWLLLVGGYLLITVPIAYSFMYLPIKNFSSEILDAAKLDCKSTYQIIKYIEIPILKRFLLSVFMQIFVIIFGEFTIGYTMQVSGVFPLISLTNYSLASSKYFLESSALNTVIILFLSLLLYLSHRLAKE